MFDLRGRHAIVLAGTSTLGRAMAHGLASHGARVVITGRDLERAQSTARELATATGGQVHGLAADATQKDDLARLLDDAVAAGGPVHVLLNCPGQNSATPFFALTAAEWEQLLAVNLGSAVFACQVFGQHMVQHGERGSIINISSAAAGPPLSKVFTYSVAKAGLNSVTQFLARELAPHGVRVNAIVPGFFPAAQNRAILSEERVRAILQHTPMARFGGPEELAGTAVWLASEAASGFVTGALIRVDGGFGAMTI